MFQHLMSNARSRQNHRRNRPGRRLAVEPLQPRELLAGDVTASVTEGDLVISGDHAANGVIVSRIDDTTYAVKGTTHGGADTRINGVPNGKIVLSGVTDDVRADLWAGNDSISLHGRDADRPLRAPDDVIIYTQSGDDEIKMFHVAAGDNIVVNSGSGNDQFIAVSVTTRNHLFVAEAGTPHYAGDSNFVNIYGDSRIGGQLNVKLNRGNDAVKVSDTYADTIWVEARDGDDSILVRDLATRSSIFIDPGNGSDRTTVEYADVGGSLVVREDIGLRSANDDDQVTISRSVVDDYLWITGNRGSEKVRISSTTADKVYAALGDGDDFLSIKYTTIKSGWTLDGGLGHDRLNRYGNSQHFGSRAFNEYLYLWWL